MIQFHATTMEGCNHLIVKTKLDITVNNILTVKRKENLQLFINMNQLTQVQNRNMKYN
jgi:hypothetical protein